MSALRTAVAIVGTVLSAHAAAGTIVVNGSISTADSLALDFTGNFFYDAFNLTTTTAGSVTVSLTAGPKMLPWLANWDHVVVPTYQWQGGAVDVYGESLQIVSSATPGATVSLFSFAITPGVTYQLAPSTLDYLPGAGLDNYVLTVDYGALPDGAVTLTPLAPVVPEPETWALLAGGLALLGRRLRTRAGH
ncbi:MAG TPA: PEP-CTERM sorting domain-containing protein [Rhodocyclaceae bacterium]|nr:PEP-CTERM sorting domain-containing protein [Rhodocyclaceae bacterium]